MSSLHSIKKSITAGKLRFPVAMYNNVFGSLAVCAYIFSTDKDNFPVSQVSLRWKKIAKTPEKYIDFSFDDPAFIDKALSLFGLTRPDYFPIAMVQSNINVLFAPYDEDTKAIYPLREDGFCQATLRKGKIFPIDFQKAE